jgi:diadenylate cyclase
MFSSISDNFIFLWQYIALLLQFSILFVVIYWGLFFLRGTRAVNVLAGIIICFLLLALVADALKFEILSELLQGMWTVFPVAIIIIFHPEIRRAFAHLGSRNIFARQQKREKTISEVVEAVKNLSLAKIGAIIVFQRQIGMKAIISSGVKLDAGVNHSLIEALFQKSSPLHDGGIVIENDKLVAAHCIFPLSQNSEISDSMGTRHRAALGIAEETDAVAVTVSEESGSINIAYSGKIIRNVSIEKLARFLRALLTTEKESIIEEIFSEKKDGETARDILNP